MLCVAAAQRSTKRHGEMVGSTFELVDLYRVLRISRRTSSTKGLSSHPGHESTACGEVLNPIETVRLNEAAGSWPCAGRS
jgi:hypothetical protein